MKSFGLGACLLSAVVLLSACGGGGGGSAAMAPMAPTPQPRPAPQPDPLPTTPAGLRAQLHAVRSAADAAVVATDGVLRVTGTRGKTRLQTFCDSTQCESGSVNFTAANAPILAGLQNTRYTTISRMRRGLVIASLNLDLSEASLYGLGGWGHFHHFTSDVSVLLDPTQPDGIDGIALQAYSLGDATGTTPVSGSAFWEGMMIGHSDPVPGQSGQRVGAAILGDAYVTFDFADMDLDVSLTNMSDAHRSYSDMSWTNVPVRQGRFGAGVDSNSLQGQFYGPNHEEVGGVFERNQIIGAFGATRQ